MTEQPPVPPPAGQPTELPPFPPGHPFLNPGAPHSWVVNRWPVTRPDGVSDFVVMASLYLAQGVVTVGMVKAHALAVAQAIHDAAMSIPDAPGLIVPKPGLHHLPPMDPRGFSPGQN